MPLTYRHGPANAFDNVPKVYFAVEASTGDPISIFSMSEAFNIVQMRSNGEGCGSLLVIGLPELNGLIIGSRYDFE